MNHSTWFPGLFGLLLAIDALIGLGSCQAFGQTLPGLRQGPVQDAFNLQGARIDEQRVSRQTEVARLERIIERFESRVMRLERQLLATSPLPLISIREAQAVVQFADAQLRESERLHEQGEINEVRLAGDRLAVARAKGQLKAAEAAHTDSLIRLELDVLYAERQLLEQNREKSQLERIVAKGYMSSDGLKLRMLDVGLAEKQLQLARQRLEAQQKSVSDETPAPSE